MNHVTHHLNSADTSVFYGKSAIFVTPRYKFVSYINYNFFEYLKVVLINMGATLMISAILATLGLLKIKVF